LRYLACHIYGAWLPSCVGNSADPPFSCFAFHHCGQCTTSTGEQKSKTCKMQGRGIYRLCYKLDRRRVPVSHKPVELPFEYNSKSSLPQPDLMEQTSESFLQRLLLVIQNVDCLHVPRGMWRLYLIYQGFPTHLQYVSSTTMLPAISSWASKTTAVNSSNSLMW
jgi:hypothetical protein